MGECGEQARAAYRRFGEHAPVWLLDEFDEQSKVGFESWGGLCFRCCPGHAASEINLFILKRGQNFQLKLTAAIPGSGYEVQNYLATGSYQDIVDYLRKPGIEAELAGFAEHLDDKVESKMGEYPFG